MSLVKLENANHWICWRQTLHKWCDQQILTTLTSMWLIFCTLRQNGQEHIFFFRGGRGECKHSNGRLVSLYNYIWVWDVQKTWATITVGQKWFVREQIQEKEKDMTEGYILLECVKLYYLQVTLSVKFYSRSGLLSLDGKTSGLIMTIEAPCHGFIPSVLSSRIFNVFKE